MLELLDSSPVLHKAEELRARLSADGYLFFRGLIARDRVLGVRRSFVSVLDGCGWLAADADESRPLPGAGAVREAAPGYFETYARIQQLQNFHELGHEPNVLALMSGVFGEQVLAHPRKIARMSLPRDDEYTPPHQDYPLIQGSVDALTMWVPLGDCPREQGGLRILRGSHRRGLLPSVTRRGPGNLGVDVDDEDSNWSTVDYQAGDAVLFTSLTVHGALLNQSETLRLSADYRYQPLADPVCAGSLQPHYRPHVPEWPGVTTGWTTTDSVDAPAEVLLSEQVDLSELHRLAPTSRFLISA